MSKASKRLPAYVAPLTGCLLLSAAATQLTGCVVRAQVASPPPPAVYVAPAAEADVQANEPPPPLPTYEQPPCPVEGYIWTPGYWAWAPAGYYWVPGTWVAPPRVGLLWTPGYWGFVGGVYVFHGGYWGPHVGFYGGVNYGFGYGGVGFAGGRWVGNSFAYNQSVTNVNVTVVHNTYNETVVNNVTTVSRVSYNGGAGGIAAAPTPQERMAAQESHVPPTPTQHQHLQQAAANPALLARNNGGHPAIAATPHAGAFNAPGVVGAHGAAPVPHGAAPLPHAPAVAYTNHSGSGAGRGAAAYGKPAAPKPKPQQHPKTPQREEEKTAAR
ncbi:MAG TPA: YXWGXW repeat-containing protein [Steroidobacteraceae bacterium]|nr:YXWGXW repeat-containing protein [Steroidobacteraceae bacterium]